MLVDMQLDTFSEHLHFQAPLCPDNLFGHLIATAVPGVEEWRDGVYRRTLRLPCGFGIAALQPFPDHVACTLELSEPRDLASALDLCRFLLDLDCDPLVIDAALSADPLLAPLVSAAPGRRVPRTASGAEFAIRAVLGQQVSTKAARTHAARLVAAYGTPVGDLFLFPLSRHRWRCPSPAAARWPRCSVLWSPVWTSLLARTEPLRANGFRRCPASARGPSSRS